MSKSDQQRLREERLAQKLRENLKRRKAQAKARDTTEADGPPADEPDTQALRSDGEDGV